MANSPQFDPNRPLYNQSTYWGRYKHFLNIFDPRTLFTSKKQLEKALKLLNDHKDGSGEKFVTDEQLWRAQKIKHVRRQRRQAIIHQDTGQPIFPLFRISGIAPFTAPMVGCLLIRNLPIAATTAIQVLMQTYNAGFNFANRNATKNIPTERFVMAYIGAVTSACSISIGLNLLIRRSKSFNPATKTFIQRFVPLPAACMANVCNLLSVRINELRDGIEVFDQDGKAVGTSHIAGKMALTNTAITRVAMLAPVYFTPTIIMTLIETKSTLFKRFPRLHLPLQTMICVGVIGCVFPVCISFFPQMIQVSTSRLEPEIQQATSSTFVIYNKGI